MQNYLTADNLTVGYRGKPILYDISMNIRRGSIVTLIGPNGAGKSTILKSIIRELSPLGGSVFLDGTALEDYSDPDFAKKTAVVMTGRPDPELMTCFDVAAAGRYPYTVRFGILSKEDKKKVMDALEMVRCESLADVLFQNTSDLFLPYAAMVNAERRSRVECVDGCRGTVLLTSFVREYHAYRYAANVHPVR